MNHFLFPFNLVHKGANVVLYGAGEAGLCFYKQLMLTKYAKVVLWADKDWKEYKWRGYPVGDIKECRDMKYDYIVIAIRNADIADSVKNELMKQGVEEKKIIHSKEYYCISDYLDEDSINDEILFKRYLNYKGIETDSMTLEEIGETRRLYFERYAKGKPIRVICDTDIAVRDLILAQYYGNDYTNYKATDMAVRMMAVENYYGEDNSGFELYRRMQYRTGYDWTDRYKKLIQSYEENGYDRECPIDIGRNLEIMDGAHRLTLALYHGDEFIRARMFDFSKNRVFDEDYFWKSGFEEPICNAICEKTEELLQDANYDFVGVIWPPAIGLADELLEELDTFSEKVKIIESKEYVFSELEFWNMFRALYYTDVINEEGMKRKFELIKNSMKSQEEYRIRYFRLQLSEPQIGINPKNHTPQSKMIMRIKQIFRNRFKDRVSDYQYDILMHISDNYLQSKFCDIILNMDRDVSGLVEVLNAFDYAIVRYKEGRQSVDFPRNYIVYSDIDVLLKNSDVERFVDAVRGYFHGKYNHPWLEIECEYMNESVSVWVKMKGFKIFSVHACTADFLGVNLGYTKICLKNRIQDEKGLFYLPTEYDLPFRMIAYIEAPHKIWHKKYLIKNLSEINAEILDKALSETQMYPDAVKLLEGFAETGDL